MSRAGIECLWRGRGGGHFVALNCEGLSCISVWCCIAKLVLSDELVIVYSHVWYGQVYESIHSFGMTIALTLRSLSAIFYSGGGTAA